MLRLVSLGCFLTLLPLSTAHSFPVEIEDNYIGAGATSASYANADIVGTQDKFDIISMVVSLNSNQLTVEINSTYFDNVGQYKTEMGDLFISSNGWNPYGSAPYLGDDSSTGEDWEFAMVLDDHGEAYSSDDEGYSMVGESGSLDLYEVSSVNQIEQSSASGIYRAGQEVQFDSLGAQSIKSGSWNIFSKGQGVSTLQLTLNLENTGLAGLSEYAFHWAMSCGNDVIEGGAPVPEPSSLLLLLGAAAGAITRKRSRI